MLLPVALATWTGTAVAEEVGWRLACGVDATSILVVATLPAIIVASIGSMVRRRQPRVASLLIVLACALAVGFVCGGLYWARWTHQVVVLDASGGAQRAYEVISDPTEGSYGMTSEAYLTLPDGSACLVRVRWAADRDPLEIGQRFRAYGTPVTATPTVGGGAARWMHRNGIVASVSVRGVEDVGWGAGMLGTIGRIRSAAIDRLAMIPGSGGALTTAVVLGDRTRIDGSELDEDFAVCGLAHLVAVSGSHLVVVAALVLWALRSLRWSRWAGAVLLIVLLTTYTVLTGLQDSAVRALVMTSVGMAAPLAGRRRDAASALCACTVVLISIDPTCAFSLGFSLSVAAVGGLIILSPLLAAWLRTALPPVVHGLAEPLGMTLAAQFVTIPLTVPVFSSISLVAPLANIVCAPLVTVMIALGLPAVVMGLIPLPPIEAAAGLALGVVGAMGNLSASFASSMAHIPYASIAVQAPQGLLFLGCLLAVVLLWALWPHPRPRLARCALALSLVGLCIVVPMGQRTTGAQLVMLDVGQGDAIVIRDGGTTVLVDTGPEDGDLRAALARNGIRRLDAVVITHLHDDHYGSLASLYGTVPIGKVVFARGVLEQAADDDDDDAGLDDRSEGVSYPDSSQSAAERAQTVLDIARRVVGGEGVVGVDPGDVLNVGSISLTVLAPDSFVEQGGNADSLILLGRCDADGNGSVDDTILLTGDGESDVTGPLIASGLVGDVDVLKVGHHGSRASVDERVAAVLDPEVALISCGAGNRYGHPTQECLDALEALGASVYRTDLRSDVTVDLKVTGPEVTCATMSAA